MKTTVLFDLGKVLLDFDKRKIIDGFRMATSLSEEEVERGLRMYHELEFETGAYSPQEFYEQVNEGLSLNMTFGQFRDIWRIEFREIPTMVETFHRIRARHKTYIVSNTDPLHFPYILEQFPWLSMFDDRAISYEIGVRKPDTTFFIKALDRFDKKPAECVYIDDLEENVASARTLGIDSIRHVSPEQTRAALEDLGVCVD